MSHAATSRALDADQVLELRSLFSFFTEFDPDQLEELFQIDENRKQTEQGKNKQTREQDNQPLPIDRRKSIARQGSVARIADSSILKQQNKSSDESTVTTQQELKHFVNEYALLNLLHQCGCDQYDLLKCRSLINRFAHDPTVGLSFDDFLVLYATVTRPLQVSDELKLAWRLMDTQHSGRVKVSVIKNVLTALFVSRRNKEEFSQREQRIELMIEEYKRHHHAKNRRQPSIHQQITTHYNEQSEQEPTWTFDEFVTFMFD